MSKNRHRNLYGPLPGPSGAKPSRRTAPARTQSRGQAMQAVSGVRPGGLQRVWGAANRVRNQAARDYSAGDGSALARGRAAVRVKENMVQGTRRAPRRN